MPLTAAGLKAAIISEFSGPDDSGELDEFAEKIATAIIDYITANALVTVTGVTPGAGTAPGTVS